MNLLIEYPVPEWVRILFLLLIPAPLILTVLLTRSAFVGPDAKRACYVVGIFFLLYVAYVTLMGFAGQFQEVFFPPKVLLFTTFPFAFFLFLYVAKTTWYARFLKQVALDRLVAIHIFRLIGGFFLILACYEALPRWFALIAGTGDMLTAIASLWVARGIRKRRAGFRRITWYWNTIGLIDIIFTAVSANVLTKLSIDSGIMGVDTLAMFPYYYIPALAPPLIVFYHYAIYQKLNRQEEFIFLT